MPKRRAAAKTYYYKYQLATDARRAEENDLKRALQQSLQDQHHHLNDELEGRVNATPATKIVSSTNSSDVSSRSNNSSRSSNDSIGPVRRTYSLNKANKQSYAKSLKSYMNGISTTNSSPIVDTQHLSTPTDQNSPSNLKLTKKRAPQGSWSLLGVPEEKFVFTRDGEPPRRLICYPAIKHVEGDVIQVRDSVILRSSAKKTDLSYVAKVCSFWEDAETGNVMMSLYWYYRPEQTECGRKPQHLPDELFASRHRDVDSVECIDDKCYVLTFNEYCRYRKRLKMEQADTNWSLTDVTIPVSNESYPRRDRIPDMSVSPDVVFICRQIYDSRLRQLVKNPLINSKYGHV